MSDINFYSSDDNAVEGTILVDGVYFPIASGSTVIAFIQDIGHTKKIINDITILETDDGNDWPLGEIKGIFSDSDSAALSAYDFKEVEVVVRITTGVITQSFVETVMANKLL